VEDNFGEGIHSGEDNLVVAEDIPEAGNFEEDNRLEEDSLVVEYWLWRR